MGGTLGADIDVAAKGGRGELHGNSRRRQQWCCCRRRERVYLRPGGGRGNLRATASTAAADCVDGTGAIELGKQRG